MQIDTIVTDLDDTLLNEESQLSPYTLAVLARAKALGIRHIAGDIVLDRNQRILLPEDHPVRALERLLALDQAQDMLARDLASVDLRLPNRPTLRLTPYAMNELRRANGLEPLPEPVETEL